MDKKATRLGLVDGRSVPAVELEAWIGRTLEKAQVAGLSCAIINDSQVAYYETFGYMNRSAGTRNNEKTVFAAASISKSVFAYLAMLLVEEEVVNLDKPLYEYLAKPLWRYPGSAELEGDERYKRITARMVLSHSTGFLPHWAWPRLAELHGHLCRQRHRHRFVEQQ